MPTDHLPRSIDRFVDLTAIREHLGPFYSETGGPSIDPELIIRMLIIGYCFGLASKRHQSGEVDYTGAISRCGDRRIRKLLCEAANVMLTRCKGELKLKTWAFSIATGSTNRKARIALARRLAITMHAMLRNDTVFHPA